MSRQVAVVGCGQWGKNLIRNFDQLRALACICDSDESALQTQAERYPDVCLSNSVDDLLGRDDVRAVAIATPAGLHYRHAKEALLSGKDVFVEKPLALTYDEGRDLVELAREQDAVLMVGHILEYHPAIVCLKDLVRQGELGTVRYLYSNRLNLGKVRQEENILWSFAPHDISVIVSLAGEEPSSVTASGGSYLQPGIVDVTVSNLLFDNGIRAHIFVSWLHPCKEQKLVVVGERKTAVFDDTVRDGKLKLYDTSAGHPESRRPPETTPSFADTEPLQLECQHFLDCIRERKRPLTNGERGLSVLKVLTACQLSLGRGGEPVSLTEVAGELPV